MDRTGRRRRRNPLAVEPEAPDAMPDDPASGGVAGFAVVRVIAGVVLVLALLGDIAYTRNTINNALHDTPQASAIQVIQIYAEGLFYGVMAVGTAIGVYILTRGIDGD